MLQAISYTPVLNMQTASIQKDPEIFSIDWEGGIPGSVLSVVVAFIVISGIRLAHES